MEYHHGQRDAIRNHPWGDHGRLEHPSRCNDRLAIILPHDHRCVCLLLKWIPGPLITYPFFFIFEGWFILLTSLLTFWRVKRWERNILASQRETTVSGRDAAGQSHVLSTHLHRFVNVPMRDMGSLLRNGLGLSRRSRGDSESSDFDVDPAGVGARAVPMIPLTPTAGEETARREMIIAMFAHDPAQQRQIIQAFRDDDQLLADMRAAGML